MDQATVSPFMLGQTKSSTASMILRDQDALSQALRQGSIDDIDDIVQLNQNVAVTYDAPSSLSSLDSSSTAVFSSHANSTATKPTSITTNYPPMKYSDKGKRKLKVSYASSLSGTHGSASEADAERREVRRVNLLAMGGWVEVTTSRPLKGEARAKERLQRSPQPRQKKFEVVLTQDDGARKPLLEHSNDVVLPSVGGGGPGNSSRQQSSSRYSGEALHSIEEGNNCTIGVQSNVPQTLTRTRVISIVVLVSLMTLTIASAAFGACHTGKRRMFYTKGIVFVATGLIAFFTILAMLVARRAVLEALLAGLIELIFGFTLLMQLEDFM